MIQPVYRIRRAGALGRRFRVLTIAANGEVVCVSQVLSSRDAAEDNIAAQITVAKHGVVEDTTAR